MSIFFCADTPAIFRINFYSCHYSKPTPKARQRKCSHFFAWLLFLWRFLAVYFYTKYPTPRKKR